ncbi:MAG: CPBP family intramembrane metalloprotease [Bdellovibrionales bacterium]|nr:CPBP family intramembrane metalloprotease [Bdellovibrionales bacterium]
MAAAPVIGLLLTLAFLDAALLFLSGGIVLAQISRAAAAGIWLAARRVPSHRSASDSRRDLILVGAFLLLGCTALLIWTARLDLDALFGGPLTRLSALFYLLLLAPAAEEWVFREALFRELRLALPTRRGAAHLINGVTFGLSHLNYGLLLLMLVAPSAVACRSGGCFPLVMWGQVVLGTALGVLLSALRERENSCLPGMALHALMNAGVVAFYLLIS